jgi:ABC-2 type transport system permease protein
VRNALTIARKELRVYFVSPLFYVITALFVFLFALFFAGTVIQSKTANFGSTFNITQFVMIFVVPLLTMRLIAQEKQQGTIEILLTNPVRDAEVVVGKFLAGVGMFLSMMAFTLVSVLFLLWTAVDKQKFLFLTIGKIDFGPILAGYVGFILLVCGFLAIGIFASSLTQNQIIAALISFAFLIVLIIGSSIGPIFFGPPLSDAMAFIGSTSHLDAFSRGAIGLPDLVYTLSMIGVPLYLAVVALGARRWH